MNFHPRTTIKGQALVDFIVEFTYSNAAKVTRMVNSTEAVKAAEVRERANFIPTKGDVLNNGSYMWTVPPTILGLELA